MMGLREFVELFDKNEVKNLFNALSLCIEYVRIDLHVFNIGAYVTCLYSNDLESLSQTEGCKMIEEDNIPTYETSVLRAVAHEWVKVENFENVMKVVFKFLHENERGK